MRQGFLLPSFHKAYWMGYTNPIRDGTTWVWTDSTLTALNGTGSGSGGTASASTDGSTYKHWGMLVLTVNGVKSSYSEPNNRGGSEYCAVGDFTQAYGPGMLPAVAGWADASCTDQHIAMCKVTQAAWSLRFPCPVSTLRCIIWLELLDAWPPDSMQLPCRCCPTPRLFTPARPRARRSCCRAPLLPLMRRRRSAMRQAATW